MADEKGIERFWVDRPHGPERSGTGPWVKCTERLDALGEAKGRADYWKLSSDHFRFEATEANKRTEEERRKLETLRSACKQWRRETEALNARQGLILVASDRALFEALDVSEDTEKQSGGAS